MKNKAKLAAEQLKRK